MPDNTPYKSGFMHLKSKGQTSKGAGLLTAGFLVSISIFVVFMSYGIYQLQNSQQQVRELALNFNTKSRLIEQMYNAARDRTAKLYAMVSSNDVFRYDELYIQFNNDGANFAVARLDLLDMELADQERYLLEKQSRFSKKAIPLQFKVVDLMYAGKSAAALNILTGKAVPAQNEALQVLRQLQNYQHINAKKTSLKTQATQQRIVKLLYFLSGLIILLSIVVATFVVRRSIKIEQEIHIEKEFAELTLSSIGDAVITTDANGRVLIMNKSAEKLTGWSSVAAHNKSINNIFHIVDEDSQHRFINPIEDVLTSGEVIHSTSTEILIDRHNKQYGIEHSVAPIKDRNDKIHGLIIVFRDVTETRALTNQLSHQATHDNLTGLINRREFEIRIEHALLNVRNDNVEYALFFMDLDRFKLINDTCGHNAGDEVLRQISTILKQHIRKLDTLARLGGDEFGVLLEACSLTKAEQIAYILLRSINDFRFTWQGQTFDIGVSIGVSPITALTSNTSELLSAADTACFLAKDKGRNRIHIYHPEDSELEQHRGEVQWVQRINEAIDEDNFILYYQPIVGLDPSKPKANHYEILVRMVNDAGDLIPPMAFIPAAERYQLMPLVDQWVIRHALFDISQILKQSNGTHNESVFTINISGQSLSTSNFSHYILEQLTNFGIDPTLICLEVTETAAIANMSSAIQFISNLKMVGCRFALDDFGSGLSSFSYLKTLPVDYIKIDGSFVRDICDDKTDRAFVESITQIAHVMNIETIAEFVEGEKIHKELQRIGVDYAQGFYIATPSPLSSFLHGESKRVSS